MGWFYHLCPCQELCLSLTEEDIQRGSKKRELDALRRHYIQEKGFKVIEIWECEWWRLYKITNTVEQHIREHFLYRRSLAAEQLLGEIKEGKLFGYVQCDIEVPENLRSKFDNFIPKFKETLVSKSDIEDLTKNYAEEGRLLSQPQKKLISILTLQNGTLFTPLFLFYLQLGLVVSKVHRSVEYTRKMFQQLCTSSSGLKNPNWRVVAEAMILLAPTAIRLWTKADTLLQSTSLTKKPMQPFTVNCSKRQIMWTNHCMKLNSPKHRLNTKSQSLSGSSFFNTQICEYWSCTTTSSRDSVMWTSSKS